MYNQSGVTEAETWKEASKNTYVLYKRFGWLLGQDFDKYYYSAWELEQNNFEFLCKVSVDSLF